MKTTIRIILTIILVIMVYREAGPWTSITICFLAVANEMNAEVIRRIWSYLGMNR